MRYSIFDFNQEMCVSLGLTMDDLLLMDYIQRAAANPSMKHHNKYSLYVWLSHEKILQDLPILNISKETLKKHLKKLVDLELLDRAVISNDKNRGSKAYYGLTDKFISLQFSGVKNDTCSIQPGVKNDTCSPRPGVKNDTPDRVLVINKQLKDISIKNTNSKSLVKKKSLYQKMQDEILLFTKDTKVQEALTQFLDLQLEIYKEQGKTYYSNIFKSRLKKLKTDFDKKDWLAVIENATEHGWQNFYPVKEYDKPSKKKRACDEGLCSDKYTDEEWEEIKKWQQEQIDKGEQMVF